MTALKLKGYWNITKGKLKQKWATLTDDNLQFAGGKHEELVGQLQHLSGDSGEAAEKAMKEKRRSTAILVVLPFFRQRY